MFQASFAHDITQKEIILAIVELVYTNSATSQTSLTTHTLSSPFTKYFPVAPETEAMD